MRSVSAASSGVSVSRSSPFARTCVRVGERDRTLRALLDEQDADPALGDRLAASRRRGRRSVGASPSDGSSRRRIDGLATSARAIASCCCCPPDSAPACRSRNSSHDREQLADLGDVVVARPSERGRAASPSRRFSSTRELGEEPPPLGDERDAALRDRLRAAAAERAIAEADLAASRRDQPHDRVQRRRLPRAVRADEPDDLAGRDVERDAADGSDAAVRDLEIANLERAHSADRRLAEVRRGDVEVAADLARRALGERPALVEHLDPVADVHDQRHVVVDEEHARVVVVAHRADDLGERRHLRLRKTRRGLVHEDEPRLGRERPCDAEPSLVAVRERAGRCVRIRLELERLEQRVGATPRLPRSRSDAERRHLDVLPHGEPAERAAVLEGPGETRPPAAVRPPARDVASFELDRALVREVEAGEEVHERRLPGAVRADEADDLVPVQLERHAREAPARPRRRARRRRPGAMLRTAVSLQAVLPTTRSSGRPWP